MTGLMCKLKCEVVEHDHPTDVTESIHTSKHSKFTKSYLKVGGYVIHAPNQDTITPSSFMVNIL
jgi:hypothetical protein